MRATASSPCTAASCSRSAGSTTSGTGPYLKCARVVGDVHRQVPPARRQRGLRRAGPHGPGLLDALPAHRRPGQLRLGRRRSAGGHALHRVPHERSSPRELLADIDKETVDWQPNYDDKELEPTVLPTQGSEPAHQRRHRHRRRHGDQHPAAQPRRDHRRRARADRRTRSSSDDELIKLVPGPDFPTGGFIYGRVGIRRRTRPAAARSSMRGVAHVEEIRKDRHGDHRHRDPVHGRTRRGWIETIAELVRDKKLEGITDIRDESRPQRHARRVRAQARRERPGRARQPVQA